MRQSDVIITRLATIVNGIVNYANSALNALAAEETALWSVGFGQGEI